MKNPSAMQTIPPKQRKASILPQANIKTEHAVLSTLGNFKPSNAVYLKETQLAGASLFHRGHNTSNSLLQSYAIRLRKQTPAQIFLLTCKNNK